MDLLFSDRPALAGESYVKFLADRITGRDVDTQLLWKVTVGVFFATTLLSALLEWRSRL